MAGAPVPLVLLLLLCLTTGAKQMFSVAYDMCVADLSQPRPSGSHYPWYPCAPQRNIAATAFKYSDLKNRGDTENAFNATATIGTVKNWPGLNTLGMSIARLDLAPGGVIPPHTHLEASELLFVLEGSMYTGFVSYDNKLYAQTVHQGEAFIFPKGLLHFQHNTGTEHASSISVMNAEYPGLQMLPAALFASGLSPEVVSKSVFISDKEALLEGKLLQAKYATFMNESGFQ